MAKKSASVAALEELHYSLAVYFRERLADTAVDPDDEDAFKLPLATGEVTNMIAFLKHNNISAAPDNAEISALSTEFAEDLEAQRIAKAEKLLEAADADSELYDWLK